MAKPKSEYSIQTVTNALRMLEAFYRKEELGVSELSRKLGLHKNNVFRLLATLEQRGYIEQSAATERYRLGTRCLELGQAFSRGHTLLRSARPALEALVTQLGETAHVAVLRDQEVVHLDGVLPDQLVLTALRIGQRLPAHCTALGKVLLACADPGVRERLVRSVARGSELPRRTGSTITDAQKLLDQLSAVSAQGFAVDLEECEPGMRCVAAPVYDAAGGVAGAISVSGPAFRLADEPLHGELARRVVAAADRVSQELGRPL